MLYLTGVDTYNCEGRKLSSVIFFSTQTEAETLDERDTHACQAKTHPFSDRLDRSLRKIAPPDLQLRRHHASIGLLSNTSSGFSFVHHGCWPRLLQASTL